MEPLKPPFNFKIIRGAITQLVVLQLEEDPGTISVMRTEVAEHIKMTSDVHQDFVNMAKAFLMVLEKKQDAGTLILRCSIKELLTRAGVSL